MARRRMLAPINSIKHYVQTTNATLANGAAFNIDVASAVIAPATASTFSVHEGAVIKAVHLEYWLCGAGATGEDTQFNFAFYKRPAGVVAMTFSESNNLQAYVNKKNIFYTSQGVLSTQADGANSIPVVRGWFAIPKGKQRMGLGDKLSVIIATTGTILQRCGMSTYKEYN